MRPGLTAGVLGPSAVSLNTNNSSSSSSNPGPHLLHGHRISVMNVKHHFTPKPDISSLRHYYLIPTQLIQHKPVLICCHHFTPERRVEVKASQISVHSIPSGNLGPPQVGYGHSLPTKSGNGFLISPGRQPRRLPFLSLRPHERSAACHSCKNPCFADTRYFFDPVVRLPRLTAYGEVLPGEIGVRLPRLTAYGEAFPGVNVGGLPFLRGLAPPA